MKCPKCEGKGWYLDTRECDNIEDYTTKDCDYCNGTGRVTLFRWLKWIIGGRK